MGKAASNKERDPMLLNRIVIHNWKNFKEADVKIGHRLFLIGPNASGKSNFLDIFRFIREICMPGGGLTQAVNKKRGGVSNLRCFWARRYSDISINFFLEDEANQWTYLLKFNQDNQRRPIITEEKVSLNEDFILSRPEKEDKEDEER
ncbi:MAG TPA: AAA family ATPase, partial [bacterium]|nr:AAA family ATPase [bacterium]